MVLRTLDPYTNPHLKPPGALRPLCDVLEARAADHYQRLIRERVMAAALRGLSNAAVLEVGSGTGAVARALAQTAGVARVVGIDPSPTFVEHARELAAASGVRGVAFEEGSGGTLPRAWAGSFDVVVLWTVLIHVPPAEVPPILTEARCDLSPRGRIVLADNDLAGWSLATSAYDPLAPALEWYIREHVPTPWLPRAFPQRLCEAGFVPGELVIETVVDTERGSFGHTHVVLRALHAFSAAGVVGPELALAMEAEVERRVDASEFRVVLPYAVCTGRHREDEDPT